MMPLESNPYQKKLLNTFWDMADIFFFKRKDGSLVEKIFVDYWFGIEFTCTQCDFEGMVEYTNNDGTKNTDICDMCQGKKTYGGELANTTEELIEILQNNEIPTDDEEILSAYDVLWNGTEPQGYINMADKTKQRWAMFKKYGAFKDGYRGIGDTKGNIIVDVPLADGGVSKTLFSSHTDTVHRTDGFQQITYTENPSTGYIIQSSNNECLGGDDGTGVWLMTKLIEAGVPGRYIFHRAEEVGGRGSSWIESKGAYLLFGYKRAIAFDRKDKNSVITYQSCSRCCSDTFAEELASNLIFNAKQYYLERFKAGDSVVMFDLQAPVTEMRTRWLPIKGAQQEKVTTTNSYGHTSTTWKAPTEEIQYPFTPKNEFWEAVSDKFQVMSPNNGVEPYEFSSDELQGLLENYANEDEEGMMKLLEAYLKFKEEVWTTDTGGSFTDTANYTDVGGPDGKGIPECANLSCGYYNAHTQSEYQDYQFLEVFIEGLIATPWEELYTANPPERGYQTTGYTTYRNTYVSPNKSILATASDSEIATINRKKQDQTDSRKKQRDEKNRMMDEFGFYDDEGYGERYGWEDEEYLDIGEDSETISSFWDDYQQGSRSQSSLDAFYMES
jgi:hypothetical protein